MNALHAIAGLRDRLFAQAQFANQHGMPALLFTPQVLRDWGMELERAVLEVEALAARGVMSQMTLTGQALEISTRVRPEQLLLARNPRALIYEVLTKQAEELMTSLQAQGLLK